MNISSSIELFSQLKEEIKIKISATKFIVGGADMFAANNKNQHNATPGIIK